MAHSTTSTSTFILHKYSKSYPKQDNSQNQLAAPDSASWQHFTNPTIRLVLDIRKSNTGDLESVRLRIIWAIDVDNDAGSQVTRSANANELVLVRALSLLGTRLEY